MESKICLFLFGIITFTDGKPASDESTFLIASENELQNLLKTLYNQGKYDISFSHHEDGPNIHHNDITRIFPHDESSHHHHHRHRNQQYGNIKNTRPRAYGSHKQNKAQEQPSLTNIQTLNLFLRKRADNFENNNDDSEIENILGLNNKSSTRSLDNKIDDVFEFLRELDDNLEDDNRLEPCEGGRCGRDRDDWGDDRANCNGGKCSTGRIGRDIRSTENRDDNDCRGDRCGRDRGANQRDDNCVGDRCDLDNDNDDRDECRGDRCGRNNDDRNNNKNLRCRGSCGTDDRNNRAACVGNRCGRNRYDDDENDIKLNLRCSGSRCGKDNRNDNNRAACAHGMCSRDRDNDDDGGDNILRCFGEGCGRANDRFDCPGNRCGNNKFDEDDDYDDIKVLRCNGNNCGRDWFDRIALRERRLPNGDEHIKRVLRPLANKFKINDELDAIVVDINDLDKALGKSQYDERDDNQERTQQLLENINIENLLEDNNRDSINGIKSSKSRPIDATVVDLSNARNDLSQEIKELITELKMPAKKNKRYKNRFPKKTFVNGPGESKILSHNEDNNNVYVPKWLLDEVVSKSSLRESSEHVKNLLPLTSKQKQRLLQAMASKSHKPSKIFRRSTEEDIGVPFHLEIQGLGQVNP